ncbi:hypothetical protein CLOM_g24601 [Closterium sp. NIES-68]|nr:hypothetical protein CLOM_g24601 [Closterium sp. NIES-68]
MGVPPGEDVEQYADPNAFNEGEIPPTDALPGEDAVPGGDVQTQDPFLPPEDAYMADVPAPEDIPADTTTAPENFPTDTATPPEDAIPADGTIPADGEPQPTESTSVAFDPAATTDASFSPATTDPNFDPDAATPVDATVPTDAAPVAADDTVTAGNGTMYDFQGAYEKMKGGDLSTEAIIGIVAGVAGGMVLVMCCACICWIRQRNIWRAKYGDGNAGAIEM